jgi:hypothetical protein
VRARALSPVFRVVGQNPGAFRVAPGWRIRRMDATHFYGALKVESLYRLYSVCHPPLKLAQRPNVRGDHVGPESTRCPSF